MVASLALTMVLDPKMMRFPLPDCTSNVPRTLLHILHKLFLKLVCPALHCMILHFAGQGGEFALEKSPLVKQRPPPLLGEKHTL